MSGRSRFAGGVAVALALLALSVVPALAKEGSEARLDTAISRDAEPGSTLEVGWSTFYIENGREHPIYGSPVYVKLVAPDGTSSEAAGEETPAGSGHYTASIVVPSGGIDEVIVALVGYSCYQDGDCQRADYVFPLADDPLVSGSVLAGGPAPATPFGSLLAPLVAIGSLVVLAVGLGALIVARRRQVGVGTAGGASGD